MSRIHENLEDKDFDKPATVGEATVCKDTGMLPTYNCPTITELFDTTELPTKRCTKHGGGGSNRSYSSYSSRSSYSYSDNEDDDEEDDTDSSSSDDEEDNTDNEEE